ncbi:hypothetical protein BDB00DRAFT_58395 [Zychaea mexicana]|uniref:uncharacterized protein n=1 Tax=Zychaea mexicana TaxID=64656 RepID=UPI0022FE3E46|nr:uncharacterized protein BDB00DRAFT_58395 [Zychaea mexicana]KAI9488286.1 hypothetical protein BDB00DRAFT_58395 [Zychaea mexicana]
MSTNTSAITTTNTGTTTAAATLSEAVIFTFKSAARPISSHIDEYEEILAQQPHTTGESWIYHSTYYPAKAKEQKLAQAAAAQENSEPINKRNRPSKTIKTIRYFCHRKDYAKPQQDGDLEGRNSDVDSDDDSDEGTDDNIRRRPIQKKSKQVGCGAKLSIKVDVEDPTTARFEYKDTRRIA